MRCDICKTDPAYNPTVEVRGEHARIKCQWCRREEHDAIWGNPDAPPTVWDIPSVRARWET